MPHPFRLFVSSTFGDLVAECNALQQRGFPALRQFCQVRGGRFQTADLRWGVRDEAGLDQRTMAICLEELRRCQATGVQPNFLILLGDRYGWRPRPQHIAAVEFEELSCPSEVLALRWGDIDWERSRFTVRSTETEHHEGKDRRIVPIFPELLTHWADAFDRAEPGQEFVVTRCRNDGVNLRTQLEGIIERAGLIPWPKLFQNLRASRKTELAERYPIHVVCAWLVPHLSSRVA